jgi:hypothetical protein
MFMASASMAAQPPSNVVDAHGRCRWQRSRLGHPYHRARRLDQDCCTYASAIGVNYVLYQGDWTGKPDRVIVLNVWPSKLPSLDVELQDDQQALLAGRSGRQG